MIVIKQQQLSGYRNYSKRKLKTNYNFQKIFVPIFIEALCNWCIKHIFFFNALL